jgi:HEPN domain-containing protein
MNSPERLDEICRWIRFAREDLEADEALLATENFVPRHVCWLAQQAAEKVLKGALVSEGVDFPFRHDLDALRNLLPGAATPRGKLLLSPLRPVFSSIFGKDSCSGRVANDF